MASKLKGKPRGGRVTVKMGTHPKTKKPLYSYMLKSVATYFGIGSDTVTGVKTKTGRMVYPRGSVSGGSIKVPKAAPTGKVVKPQYLSMPIPPGMDHRDISEFLVKRCTKNKPKNYVTRDGRTVSIIGAK